ncbi:hypothetical protein GCM10010129_80590 [Streptomyces fumigatiscleroticus]|nr:hypothetical protein GCM10010129_80590 [Streptomyces fumigatiscleroticus]
MQALAHRFTRHATALTAAARAGDRPAGHPPEGQDDGAEEQAAGAWFSLAHLQDLLEEWITARWHTRPQQGLQHPLLSRAALTPDEMWRVLLGTAGAVPLPLGAQHYAELLPVQHQAVTDTGIRLGRRRYDHACLDEHRGRPCPGTDGGRWEVHHHPYDPRQIYIRLPDNLLHALPWTDHAHALRPFDDTVRHRTARLFATRRSWPGPDTGGTDTARSTEDRCPERERPAGATAPVTAPPPGGMQTSGPDMGQASGPGASTPGGTLGEQGQSPADEADPQAEAGLW